MPKLSLLKVSPENASKLPLVVLLGRPNVGKSSLYNRLLGSREAVVADVAGTTRDRLEKAVSLGELRFRIADMAGLEPVLSGTDTITASVQEQVSLSLARANVVVWVVDGAAGDTAADARIAELLRRMGKPVLMAVNKLDAEVHAERAFEFAAYGFAYVGISSLHNLGISDFCMALETVLSNLPERPETEEKEVSELRVALVGRPNVGKSTLLNQLLGESRSVVSPIPGTTRDAVDTVVPAQAFLDNASEYQTVRLIDTAGIRSPKMMGHEVEAWSVVRTLGRVDAADVVCILLDAAEGPTHQDMVVAEKVVNAGRPLVLVANKWDLVLSRQGITLGSEEDQSARDAFQQQLLRKARFITWCQLLFVSASEGINVKYLGRAVLRAMRASAFVATEEQLEALVEGLKREPRLKNLMSIRQTRAFPPTFIARVEGRTLPHFTTRRAIDNRIRDGFSLGPTPIKLWIETSLEKRSTR